MRSITRFVIVSMFLISAVVGMVEPALADDHGDTCATATNVSPSSNTNGAISPAGDKDVFKIQMPSDGQLIVTTNSDMDTYGTLRDSNCISIQTDDSGGTGANFQISRWVSAGTYYVEVRHYYSTGTGNYVFHVESDLATDDHGNNCTTASIANAHMSQASGNLSVYGDKDFFRLDLPSDGLVTVYSTSNMDTVGELRDSNCFSIQYADGGGTGSNFLISRELTQGTYYVEVRNYYKTDKGPYVFHVESDFADDDHGNNCATSTSYSGTSMAGQLSVYGDKDFFQIVMPSAGSFKAFSTSNMDTVGVLRDLNCFTITSNDSSGDFTIEQNLDAGTYYLEIHNYYKNETGSYNVSVNVPCQAKPAAPKLTKPTNGSTSTKTKVKLDWNNSNCAARYQVIVRQNSTTGPKMQENKNLTTSQFTTKSLPKNKTYYWQVKACNAKGCKASAWWSFKVQ